MKLFKTINIQQLIFLLVLNAGCEAAYTDLGARTDGINPTITRAFDAGFLDGGGMPGLVLAQGDWTARTGHPASGSVELIQHPDGVEVRFGADFESTPVPGPVILLTQRAEVGSSINVGAGDLEITTLTAASGAQSYFISEDVSDYKYVWIFCKPFGVEIARATLEEVSQ